MFEKGNEDLNSEGAEFTTREIEQQPELWAEVCENYTENIDQLDNFFTCLEQAGGQRVRVILTGAGTSDFVGQTIVPYLNLKGDRKKYSFEAIATTTLVSAPLEYFESHTPTLLVSFARSGNSPESVAAIQLAQKIVTKLWSLVITCNPSGKLAQVYSTGENNLVLLQPARSNDKGFAMTGSFTCMLLTAVLVFDSSELEEKKEYVKLIEQMGHEVIKREPEIKALSDLDFERVIYLGSGGLAALTQEAQLKLLELTAGKIATLFESSMGIRHGPKSFINTKTIVFCFINNNPYSRLYDLDILAEIRKEKIALKAVGIDMQEGDRREKENFVFIGGNKQIPESYLALPYIMVAQTFALLTSVKIENTPDRPSITGTVNRVVKGVTIHHL